jgi:hypothetical protein
MSSYTEKSPVIIEYPDWDVKQIKYMPPRLNDMGGKAITIVSTQTNRGLSVSTPLMITWGITDFCDEQGNSDGKFALSLSFPNDEYKTDETDEFLQKCKDFESKVIDDAVLNSELWFGKKKSKELVEDSFFPILKWSKDKVTKNLDYSKPPGLKIKVPCFKDKTTGEDKWSCQLYDVDYNKIFPDQNKPDSTPIDFVPKSSSVVCGIQCTGLWIGGKGWGVTWKLVQAIVKPKVVVSLYDRCHIKLSLKDKDIIQKNEPLKMDVPDLVNEVENVPVVEYSTVVDDSDDDEPTQQEVVVVEEKIPVVETKEPIKKKIIKKAEPIVESVPEPEPEPVVEQVPEPTPTPTVKKVIKKKVAV